MMQEFLIYGGLFLNALAAGSILPVQSEALLAGLLLTGHGNIWLLLIVATLGNTGGAALNWFLGARLETYKDRKWFPATPERLAEANRIYKKFGRWALLMSWVPIAGDALTVVAGVLKEKLWIFIVLVGIGKALRYVALAAITLGIADLI